MQFFKRTWQQIVLFLILTATGFLSFYGVSQEGYGNTYYAAAVKSMLSSWHNFFFVSFDPGGYVSIDKPPVAFWLQAASAKLFGFHGWSLILPQALAAVVAVAVLYHLVQKDFAKTAGLVAAAVLAVTPVLAAVARTNEVDSTLAMVVLLAAWALLAAARAGSLPLLLVAMGVVGIGFNVKMLEAFMVLPAFYAAYWFCSSLKTGRKIAHLAVATALLLAVSLSWATIVDMTPAQNRPYVGSSQTNSVLELALGYNGIQRVLPSGGPFGDHRGPTTGRGPGENWNFAGFSRPDTPGPADRAGTGNHGDFAAFGGETGAPGVWRLFDRQMAGQISWLLPLALLGALGIYLAGRGLEPRAQKSHRLALVFWGLWVLPMAVYFSAAGFFHTYYMVMMAPGLAALVGIGFTRMYRLFREDRGWTACLLPAALVTNAALEIFFLSRYPGWDTRLDPVAAASALAALTLTLIRRKGHGGLIARWATAGGLAALLVAPAAWAATPIMYGSNPSMPMAGPELAGTNRLRDGGFGGFGNADTSAMIAFLLRNDPDEKYLVAVPNAMTAAPIILQTGKAVMAVGGFMGRDPILTVERLQQMVASGQVRYFMVGGFAGFQGGSSVTDWVKEHGTLVPAQDWAGGSSAGPGTRPGGMQLYDLGTGQTSLS